MDWIVVRQSLELLGLAVAGYAIGFAVIWGLGLLAKRPKEGESPTLSRIILDALAGPIMASLIILVIFFGSAYLADLRALRPLMSKYVWPILVLLTVYLLNQLIEAFLAWNYQDWRQRTGGKVKQSLLPLLGLVARVIIVVWGIALAFALAGFDLTAFIAVNAIALIVIGFAAQETLGNVVSGIALNLDQQFAYGETMLLPGGTVAKLRKIGWRSSELEDEDGNTVVMANSEFDKQQVMNLSRPTPFYRAHVKVRVPRSVDAEKFAGFMKKQLETAGLGIKPDNIEVLVDKTFRLSYSVDVAFWMEDYFKYDEATDFVGRKTLEFTRRTAF